MKGHERLSAASMFIFDAVRGWCDKATRKRLVRRIVRYGHLAVPRPGVRVLRHSLRLSCRVAYKAEARRPQVPAREVAVSVKVRAGEAIDNCAVTVSACGSCAEMLWHAHARACSVELSALCHYSADEWRSRLRAHNIATALLEPRAHSFSFVRRREPPVPDRLGGRRTASTNLPWVRTAPPPQMERASLRARLLEILTPPINVVLSDPALCLPDRPYPYQLQGIKWLHDRDGALLADEMGLGKTMQAILAARLLWQGGQIENVFIVCPKVLIAQWQAELRKWWPYGAVHTRAVYDAVPQRFGENSSDLRIAIINYERLALQLDRLRQRPSEYDLVILDEAQRIKNPETKTAKSVKSLRAGRRWALTGTPLENSVYDVMSIFDFLVPGLLQRDTPEYVRERIAPFILRRTTEEVKLDLPELLCEDIEVELGRRQREAYRRAEREGVVELNERGDRITVAHVFALITRLMQLCNFEPLSGESAKLDRLRDELEEITQSDRKALVFSRFVDENFGLKRLAREAPESWGVLQFHGQTPDRAEVLRRFQEEGQHRVMLLNYRVGGHGLNLHAASYVYLFDRWWNPAVEDQAIKRAHRIGQQKTVMVRRFVCIDTIEERIVAKLAEKRRLFAEVIDETRLTPEAMGLTEEELFSLFKDLKARPKRRATGT